MHFFLICTFLVCLASANPEQLDRSSCADIGGTCKDWRYTNCPAGYRTQLCPGDTNIRCCLSCDTTCKNNEASYSKFDSGCNGQCKKASNYCPNGYVSGLCGGPADRKCCPSSTSSGGSGCPRIYKRSEWGARSPKSTTYMGNNVQYQIVHHTVTPECFSFSDCASRIRGIQNDHMTKWTDIGYSFLVGGDGNIYEGRGWNRVGAHTPGFNSVGYGTSFIGTFTGKVPSPAMISAYHKFESCAVSLGKVRSNYDLLGHRQTKATECPGNTFYKLIQQWPHWKSGYLGK